MYERCSGVESDVWIADDKRVAPEPGVTLGVRNREDVLLRNETVCTEGSTA
jgi:hypothetical protein